MINFFFVTACLLLISLMIMFYSFFIKYIAIFRKRQIIKQHIFDVKSFFQCLPITKLKICCNFSNRKKEKYVAATDSFYNSFIMS